MWFCILLYMNRRSFIASSTGLLGLTSISMSLGTQRALGVSFSIPTKITPSQISSNNVVISISDIRIETSNISDTESNIKLSMKIFTDTDNLGFTSNDLICELSLHTNVQ